MGKAARTTAPRQVVDQLQRGGVAFDTILDVGIRGDTPFLNRQCPDAFHYLFEPMVEWHETIRSNYDDRRYEIISAACSNEDGEAEFVAMHKSDHLDLPSHGQISTLRPGAEGERSVVQLVQLDSFVAERELEGPFILKVDVDGAETLVLLGAEQTLKACSVVVLEMTRRHFLPLANHMYERGFMVHSITGLAYGNAASDIESETQSALLQCDVFFVPKTLGNSPALRPVR